MNVDTRMQCPHCGVRTWMRDYTAFMRDHDRADGRVCHNAVRAYFALDRAAKDYIDLVSSTGPRRAVHDAWASLTAAQRRSVERILAL